MNSDSFFWGAFLSLILCGIVGTYLCIQANFHGQRIQQRAAIEAGVAEWRIDPKTGESRFEFVKPGESK